MNAAPLNITRDMLPSGLLVSVRSVAEAMEAVAGGAAIIDVKEPSRGPLGRTDADVTVAIAEVIAGEAVMTLACGELAAGERAIAAHVESVAMRLATAGLALPAAVKAGPAGLAIDEWRVAYARLTRLVMAPIETVAVAYADWRSAGAPAPMSLAAAAADAGASTILIDTFDKSAGGLLGLAGIGPLREWVTAARDRGLAVALAGRLTAGDLAIAAGFGAAIVGVRSAACAGGRLGQVRRGNVAELVGTLARSRSGSSPRPSSPQFRQEEVSP